MRVLLALILLSVGCRDPEAAEKKAAAEQEIEAAERALDEALAARDPAHPKTSSSPPHPLAALDDALERARVEPTALPDARAAFTRALVMPPEARRHVTASLRAAAVLIDSMAAGDEDLTEAWEGYRRAQLRSASLGYDGGWEARLRAPYLESQARVKAGKAPLALSMQVARGLAWLELEPWLKRQEAARRAEVEGQWEAISSELGLLEERLIREESP